MLFQKLSGNIPDTQETFRKPSGNFPDTQEMFRKPRKCARNSLGHWKHPLETLSQLLDTLGLLKILAGCSFRNSQVTPQTLRKPSEHSLRHWKHHLKASSELSGHWKFTKYFPDALSETLRQLSGHSGNILETHLDTGNTLWKPSVNSWTLWNFLKYLLDALSEILRQLSRHSGNLLKTLLDTGNTI